ncbi:GntR family transcriptional regulator [Halalkalibaculum sp. DA3122]|uniref:GntR family transcriptional regulator n=1 Tax=Halalkalibaculum sp. DA3122 TaxID=3373607 RepID=UPI0037541575
MQIDHKSSVPLYKQIEDYLRDLIESGEYDSGKFLPKEEELASQFGVSRNTVRQGIMQLVREGLLERRAGKGTYVSDQNITTYLSEWHSFTEEMLRKGVELHNYLIQSHFEAANREVAEALQIDEGKQVLKLERLRGDENHPFVYFVSWFHPRIKLTGEEDFTRPLYSILEDDYSVYPVYSNEELSAISADKKIAKYLRVDENLPILYRQRLVLDSGNRPIEYNVGYYRSDEFSYSIRFQRSTS